MNGHVNNTISPNIEMYNYNTDRRDSNQAFRYPNQFNNRVNQPYNNGNGQFPPINLININPVNMISQNLDSNPNRILNNQTSNRNLPDQEEDFEQNNNESSDKNAKYDNISELELKELPDVDNKGEEEYDKERDINDMEYNNNMSSNSENFNKLNTSDNIPNIESTQKSELKLKLFELQNLINYRGVERVDPIEIIENKQRSNLRFEKKVLFTNNDNLDYKTLFPNMEIACKSLTEKTKGSKIDQIKLDQDEEFNYNEIINKKLNKQLQKNDSSTNKDNKYNCDVLQKLKFKNQKINSNSNNKSNNKIL